MQKKETRGRKPLPKSQFKGCLVGCRMVESEVAEVEAAARRAKKSKSDWIRDVLLAAARPEPGPVAEN